MACRAAGGDAWATLICEGSKGPTLDCPTLDPPHLPAGRHRPMPATETRPQPQPYANPPLQLLPALSHLVVDHCRAHSVEGGGDRAHRHAGWCLWLPSSGRKGRESARVQRRSRAAQSPGGGGEGGRRGCGQAEWGRQRQAVDGGWRRGPGRGSCPAPMHNPLALGSTGFTWFRTQSRGGNAGGEGPNLVDLQLWRKGVRCAQRLQGPANQMPASGDMRITCQRTSPGNSCD